VWPAFAVTAVVPLWAHVLLSPCVDDIAPAFDYLGIALITTAVPHLVLIVLAVNDAARVVIGDVDTRPRRWLFLLTAVVPGLGLVLPFGLVTTIGLFLLWAVRREVRHVACEM